MGRENCQLIDWQLILSAAYGNRNYLGVHTPNASCGGGILGFWSSI